MTRTRITVDGGGVLEVRTRGTGEPLLVVQTALSVDETVPLMGQEALREGYRRITFDRRGYGSSTTGGAAPSIALDARDCLAVLTHLAAVPAHLVGVSYSAAVALDLAAQHPDAVRSLTVVEPPPRHVASTPSFLAANRMLLDTYSREGTAAALASLMTLLAGPGWRVRQEALAPGSVARIERDAVAFLTRDIPALLAWEYGPDAVARVSAPVLNVGGTESGRWFRDSHAWISSLFSDARSVTVEGAGHDLALTHPRELAVAISDFLQATGRGSPAGPSKGAS